MKSTTTVSKRKSKNLPQYRKNFWDFYLTNREYLEGILFKTVYQTIAAWHAVHIEPEDVVSEVRDLLRTRKVLSKFNPKKSALSSFLIGRVRFYTRHVLDREFRHMRSVPHISVCRQSSIIKYEDHTIGVTDLYESMRSVLTEQEADLLDKVIHGYTQVEIADENNKSGTWATLKLRGIREKLRAHLGVAHG